jgi:hypothetical protein
MWHAVYAFVALASSVGPEQQLRASAAARVYVEAEAEAVLAPAVVPVNVEIADTFHETVRGMLDRSRTFRQQCRRIGRASDLVVRVRRSFPQERPGDSAANTTIVRRRDGVIEATVLLGAAADAVELIAHEFEHILEQLDDIDLETLRRRPRTGVYLNGPSSRFETERAIAAGRRVAAEVSRAVR